MLYAESGRAATKPFAIVERASMNAGLGGTEVEAPEAFVYSTPLRNFL